MSKNYQKKENGKNATGRPNKYSKKFLKELKEQFGEYIDKTDIPIIAEFAYKNDLYKQFFYDHIEFSDLIKKCVSKKEAQLEKLGLLKQVDTGMAVFSLKQLGWRDKQDIENSGQMGVKIVDDIK